MRRMRNIKLGGGALLTRYALHYLLTVNLVRNVLLHAQIDKFVHGDHDLYLFISHFNKLFNFWHNSITDNNNNE